MSKSNYIFLALLLIFLVSCKDDTDNPISKSATSFIFLDNLPRELPSVVYPEDNFPTSERIRLGKLLFTDKRLSRTDEISCASCHKSDYAFADNTPTTKGVDGLDGVRNSISLMNVAYQKKLLREGGVPTLEMQILVPFQEHNEFDLNILDAVVKLKSDSLYQSLANQAYGRSLDAYVISRSIPAFERTLIGGDSKFDKYLNKKAQLTTEEEKGMILFFSDSLACSSCHSGLLFTSQEYANNGLYSDYKDVGKKRLTGQDSDIGVFKIPSLRNITKTAPYMHDGSLATLESVIEHYAKGGNAHRNKSQSLQGFSVSSSQKKAIIAFLKTLEE